MLGQVVEKGCEACEGEGGMGAGRGGIGWEILGLSIVGPFLLCGNANQVGACVDWDFFLVKGFLVV